MPLKKPRGRKRPSHRRAYASVALLILLGGSTIAYAFLNGYLPGGNTATGSSTTSTSNIGPTSAGCPPAPTATGNDYVCVNTSLGSFEVELFPNATPRTVANFLSLARSGFYNNLVWHRIEPGFVIQTGDPSTRNGGGSRATWGDNSSGTYVPFEFDSKLHNNIGYLGMASTGAKVGGSSQFFINLADNSAILDGNYAVFGRVIDGMSVVQSIGSVPVEQQPGNPQIHQPVTPVYITSIQVLKG